MKSKNWRLVLLVGAFVCLSQCVGKQRAINSYPEAKRSLASVWGSTGRTFYCDCAYREKTIQYKGCSYKPQKDFQRANRLEWEHVVPAYAFGRNLKAWREGDPRCFRKGGAYRGRKCAQKVSAEFRKMEGDMYNLYPSIGEVNGLRAHYEMGEIKGERRAYGECDFEIEDELVEPREEIRGEIARAYLYMHATYPNSKIMTEEDVEFFESWDESDPITQMECDRYQKIKSLQGSDNPVLANRCANLK